MKEPDLTEKDVSEDARAARKIHSQRSTTMVLWLFFHNSRQGHPSILLELSFVVAFPATQVG